MAVDEGRRNLLKLGGAALFAAAGAGAGALIQRGNEQPFTLDQLTQEQRLQIAYDLTHQANRDTLRNLIQILETGGATRTNDFGLCDINTETCGPHISVYNSGDSGVDIHDATEQAERAGVFSTCYQKLRELGFVVPSEIVILFYGRNGNLEPSFSSTREENTPPEEFHRFLEEHKIFQISPKPKERNELKSTANPIMPCMHPTQTSFQVGLSPTLQTVSTVCFAPWQRDLNDNGQILHHNRLFTPEQYAQYQLAISLVHTSTLLSYETLPLNSYTDSFDFDNMIGDLVGAVDASPQTDGTLTS